MIISKKSMFYRFLTEGFVCEDKPPPTNICPFMRRVLVCMLLTFCLYAAITFFVIAALSILTAWFMYDYWSLTFYVIGSAIWIVIFAGIFKSLFDRYVSKHLVEMNSVQTASAWARAVHDKICPEVKFK